MRTPTPRSGNDRPPSGVNACAASSAEISAAVGASPRGRQVEERLPRHAPGYPGAGRSATSHPEPGARYNTPVRRQVKGDAVRRELLPGTSPKLLQELHLLTRTGDLNADSLRKLKQVNHLVRQLRPAVEDVLARFGDPVIVDCGAGKGYLGFILHELFVGPAGKGTIVSVEARPELTAAAEARARRLGFE